MSSLAVQLVGMVLGAVVVLCVCWIWVQRKDVTATSLGGVLLGAFLVTASIWAHVQIEVSEKGVDVTFDRLQKEIAQVRAANLALTSKAARLSEATEANTIVLRDLTAAVAVQPVAGGFDRREVARRLEGQLSEVKILRRELLEPRVLPPPQ